MFKIDKKKSVTIVSSVLLVCSLLLTCCSNESKNEKTENQLDDYNYVSSETCNITAVYNGDDEAIIIPLESYDFKSSGVTFLYTGEEASPTFATSRIVVFYSDNISSYDKAYNFACSAFDKVYLYEDVMNGKPVNLITKDADQKGMKILNNL